MASISSGKARILVNLLSNASYVVINSIITIILTPYLINKLGIELYGLIPLVVSFISYLNLFTMSVANSLNRYVAINHHNNDHDSANKYFNSALWSLTLIAAILLLPILIISGSFSGYFDIPVNDSADANALFLLVLAGGIITAISSPFMVSIYVKHRFDLENIVKIAGKLFQIAMLVLLFEYYQPTLKYYGVSYLVMAVSMLFAFMYINKTIVPELHCSYRKFSKTHFIEMSGLSLWSILNQVGALLYITIAILMVNLFLGSEEAGKYAAVAQWVALLGIIGSSLSNVFTPIAYEYIAKDSIPVLAKQVSRSVKYLTLFIGLPISLICGFAHTILDLWLGNEFVSLSFFMCIMLAPWAVTIGVRPLFAIFTGLNKVKIPALVTLSIGIVNVSLIYIFAVDLNLGLIGVALSLLLCFLVKNVLFTTFYAAKITNQKITNYTLQLLPGIVMSLVFFIVCFLLDMKLDINSVLELGITGLLVSMVYGLIVFLIFVSEEDRRMFYRLLKANVI